MGDFAITLDLAIPGVQQGTFTFNNGNVGSLVPPATQYSYFYGSSDGLLSIGGISGGVAGLAAKDFRALFGPLNAPGASMLEFIYRDPSYAGLFVSQNYYGVVTQVGTTPIPAALPLFAAALGGLGFVGWRRRKAAA